MEIGIMKKVMSWLCVIIMVTTLMAELKVTNASADTITTVYQVNDEGRADLLSEVRNENINFALNKGAAVSRLTTQDGGTDLGIITNGKFDNGNSKNTIIEIGRVVKEDRWVQVDLGVAYDTSKIDRVAAMYKTVNSGPTTATVGSYIIQYSFNGMDYVNIAEVSGQAGGNNAIYLDKISMTEEQRKAIPYARYVRIYATRDLSAYGLQIKGMAVLTDGITTVNEVEYDETTELDDPVSLTVTSPDYNTLTYHIQAGENQEGHKYLVYLDGKNQIGVGVDAEREYTITDVKAGLHTVKVIATYDGKASAGIVSDAVQVKDISELVSSKKNVTNKVNNSLVAVTSVTSFYDGHNITTAQTLVDGKIDAGEANNKCLRTGAGSPQEIIIDLGDYYTAGEFDKALIAHTSNRTYAADAKIAFSLDGFTFKEVANATGYSFKEENDRADLNEVKLNKLSDYTEKAVRFVKITLSNGQSNWGYVINEISLIANTDEPTIIDSNISEPANVIVDTSGLEKIKYTIVAGEDQEDATYVVNFAGETINSEAKAGVEYEYAGIEAGTYEMKVSTLEAGWLSKGITKSVDVDGYINYLKTSLNLALSSKHSEVTATCDNDNKYENYLTGSQDISAGVWALNNGVWTDYAHHSGYLQTRPDNDEANIIYDLGKQYNKNDIHSVVSMYESNNRAATEYEIYVSATGEEDTYEKVFYAKNVKFSTFQDQTRPVFSNDKLDMAEYTQDTVRFVKLHIITGNYARHYKDDGSINWGSDGYHLCELAVMGKETLLPDAPQNVVVTSPEYNTIVVKWDDIADENAMYHIYMDENALSVENASVNERSFKVSAGTHKIKVIAVVNGMERSSAEYSVTVQTEVTTPAPTEKPIPAPTEKPTPPVTTSSGGNNNPTVPVATNPTTGNAQVSVTKPGKTKITKAQVGKKRILVKFKRVKGAQGYRIQYSLKANLKKAKTVTTKKLKATIKKLKKGKRYFIRVQAYKIVNGKKVYGAYSKKVRSKKIK